ncbi:MAG: hypothetical protein Tsb002_20750 [Wenzhouxiangellaceae bacterium]
MGTAAAPQFAETIKDGYPLTLSGTGRSYALLSWIKLTLSAQAPVPVPKSFLMTQGSQFTISA